MTCVTQPSGFGPTGQGSAAGGVYPRRLAIHRYAEVAAGNIGFRAPTAAIEDTILTGIPASIQYQTQGPNPLPKVPTDAVGRTLWRIFIPSAAVVLDSIKRDDVAIDDLKNRYKLNQPLWGAVDVQIEAELLRA